MFTLLIYRRLVQVCLCLASGRLRLSQHVSQDFKTWIRVFGVGRDYETKSLKLEVVHSFSHKADDDEIF